VNWHATSVNRFFNYARERYLVMLRRNGNQAAPWTNDKILQQYRFCNVFREDDKVTIWLRNSFRGPWRKQREVIPGVITFRFFNRIESGKLLLTNGLLSNWSAVIARQVFYGVKPIVGAAYIIKTPNGKSKLEGIIEILDNVWKSFHDGVLVDTVQAISTMEDMVEYLCTFPYIGKFTAYEIACDLQYTDFFHPTDTMTWANPGPGAQRGLQRLCYGKLGPKLYDSVMLAMMQSLLGLSKQASYWPGNWPQWDMRTVEHTLCEFDKYERARLGEGTPKQKFNGNGDNHGTE
jgi:hypothetical protein